MTDFTTQPLVHTLPGADDVLVEHHTYPTADGPLAFDLYRAPTAAAPRGAVVFVSGYPDPALAAMFGRPLQAWASYVGWARLTAASGLVAITYTNRDPADVHALVAHLRAEAAPLGLDPARLAIWACSGNVPTALDVIARARPTAAAVLYGYLLDLDGATAVADAARQFHFACPPVALDEIAATPLLVVRAGRDAMPGLDATLTRFVAAARARDLPVTLLDLPDAPHAFDVVDPSPPSRAAIEQVLAFLGAR